MSTVVTLAAHDSTGPTDPPFVDVLASGFPAGTSTVTVWRSLNGRDFKVRGLINVSAGGTVTTRDYEAAPGYTSSYRVEHFDASGDFTSWSDYSTATLAGHKRHAWIHNPLDPSTAVKVRMLAPAPGEIARPIDLEILRTLGRSVGVAIFGARSGVVQQHLDVLTETLGDADRFDALFGGYDDLDTVPILCVRTPVAMRLPAPLFAVVAKPAQVGIDWAKGGGWTAWPMVGDEISPPPEAIITALLGYDDFTAFYSGYDTYTAAYADYQTAQRDYSIAGTA